MSTKSAETNPATLRAAPASGHGGLLGGLKMILDTYRKSWQRRAAAATLQSLDDHLLKDIGLDRSEIMSVVYGLETDTTRRGRF